MAAASLTAAEQAKTAASLEQPFTQAELGSAVLSLQRLLEPQSKQPGNSEQQKRWLQYREVLNISAHLSHKDWSRTEQTAERLRTALFPSASQPGLLLGDAAFCKIFDRALEGGGWEAAKEAADAALQLETELKQKHMPWVVLVCGLNGIRKTTAVYQPWFQSLLSEALKCPPSARAPGVDELPNGGNSFFRQLDYVMATVANGEFGTLYSLLQQIQMAPHSPGDQQADVTLYSKIKDSIFCRYRTVAELFGVLLVKEAQAGRLNVMIETSGRDIGMYHYVNTLFPESLGYRKLLLHFSIDQLSFAEHSVDTRMRAEMDRGIQAVGSGRIDDLLRANLGGPYGSAVLSGVQEQENQVWREVILGVESGMGPAAGWYSAAISIHGSNTVAWKAEAAVANKDARHNVYVFEDPTTSLEASSDCRAKTVWSRRNVVWGSVFVVAVAFMVRLVLQPDCA
eukprot:gb/GEZN01008072.1/.p1 GENE.gb/GEZN01008072.1/~~gb/GEZN01008072.1/.p1  ORF type:complete len:455 (+),score=73.34 gb/GEZN01008072.1/:22-1386(+)